MNRDARGHVENAKTYLTKGEQNYRRAAKEMQAAKDDGATWVEIGEALGHSDSWCHKIIAWAEGGGSDTPFGGDDTPRRMQAQIRQAIANAPIEEIERIVADLPKERRDKIERAIVDTHPALIKRPALGVGDSIRRFEDNTSFVLLMGGALSQLSGAVSRVSDDWERWEDKATDDEKEIVQEQIRDAVASLLAINSDPQELLR